MNTLIYSTFYGHPHFSTLSIRNHLHYANLHHYSYIPHVGENPFQRQFSWAKIYLGLQYLRSGLWDLIFWMDGDSWFLNNSITLLDIIGNRPEAIHFSGDENDIFNGGHFLLRNSPDAINFLEHVLDICETDDPRIVTTHRDSRHLFDQPAILSLLGGADPHNKSTWADAFNSVNGYPGNPFRHHKAFLIDYAPLTADSCERAKSLICDRWRPFCNVLPQSTMNSYPPNIGMDDFIVHFVGNTKDYMHTMQHLFEFG